MTGWFLEPSECGGMVAITIDELQVETQETPAQPVAQPSDRPQKNHLDLRLALERLRERDLRLWVD